MIRCLRDGLLIQQFLQLYHPTILQFSRISQVIMYLCRLPVSYTHDLTALLTV